MGTGWTTAPRAWLNDWLAGAPGYMVASIDYRLSPQFKWPAQRDDLLAAIRFLRDHAAALGIDGDRLVPLLGRSAGGQMATAVAYAEVIPGVCGIVDIYGPTDFDLTWDAATRPAQHSITATTLNCFSAAPRRRPACAAYQSRQQRHPSHPTCPADADPPRRNLDINVFREQAGAASTRKLAEAGVPRRGWSRYRGLATRSTLVHFDTPARADPDGMAIDAVPGEHHAVIAGPAASRYD